MKQTYITAVLQTLATGTETDQVLSGLRTTLESRGHSQLYASILRGVLRVLTASGSDVATVTVVSEADYEKQKATIVAALAQLGTNADPKLIIDPTIIGGYVAEANATRLDTSYKAKLVTLYRSLTK